MSRAFNTVKKLSLWLLHFIFSLTVVLSTLWLCLALWIQQPLGKIVSIALIIIWLCFALSILGIYLSRAIISKKIDVLLYVCAFAISLAWYFNIEAHQDRIWNPEVAKMLHYERQGDLITLHNVRNFDWRSETEYSERWESRRFNLKDVRSANIITSYWMGPQIAHTLVSFDIQGQAPLTFSIEIRKEKTENFSAIGGFFRKFELSLVAADEKDIVYTRSHIRGEQVYFFPVNMQPALVQKLLLEYLQTADELAAQPKWYNTLTSNCTTLVFDMIQAVTQQALPSDYRLLASGYLPNYLYDLKALPRSEWNMQTWYEQAHVNPKLAASTPLTSQEYSQLIRLKRLENLNK